MLYLAGQRGGFSKIVLESEFLVMHSEGLGEMIKDDFSDTCAKKTQKKHRHTHSALNI